MQKADIAMYVAKNDRCGVAVYSSDRDGRAGQRIALVAAMWQGIDEDQFALDYQPIVDLRTGETAALEALLRWNHPQHGRLPPEQVHTAGGTKRPDHPADHSRHLQGAGGWPGASQRLTVAVNVSPRSLQDSSFPGRVREVLDARRMHPSSLALEITENVMMSDGERSVQCLNELHAMGVKLVIDDFGAGYSSLSRLRKLPVSQLKIDQSFIAGLSQGEDEALVKSIIDLAHNLKLEIIAEGVDSAALRDQLRTLGCDAAQGHFIGRPAPAEIIARLVTPRSISLRICVRRPPISVSATIDRLQLLALGANESGIGRDLVGHGPDAALDLPLKLRAKAAHQLGAHPLDACPQLRFCLPPLRGNHEHRPPRWSRRQRCQSRRRRWWSPGP